MVWKVAAVGLGVSTLVLAVMAIRGHRHLAGGAPPAGAARPDFRGSTALAAQQITLGPKAVAEAATKQALGDTRAHAREEEKLQRKG